MHGGGEDVDTDQREVALRLLGLLYEGDDFAGIVEFGNAELARIWHTESA